MGLLFGKISYLRRVGKKMGLAKKEVLGKLGGIFEACEGIDIPKGAEELRAIFLLHP
jgi:hypothetical protein